MQIQGQMSQALNMYKQNTDLNAKGQKETSKNESVEEIINNSAARVTLSMNAQVILFEINAHNMAKGGAFAQGGAKSNNMELLDFLGGKETSNGMSLKNIGYNGKPILDLTQDEAKDLVGENGFFGITQTSDRVANFVFSFSGDDLEKLQKGRDGIVQGFEEANKLFGGNLPEISYKTQERTLALIDERMNELRGKA
ncbi:hydrogenase-4 component G [Arcobacter vandammei]|uniref:hydrogenase-4 component G n=1 Tax=Arcobacter vandammei TaxID=2782243 RepID=UPI0018DF360C|nr:hydrogenase-4 component G [Arcobacter vandammei]